MKRLVLPALLLAGAVSACGGNDNSDNLGQSSPTPSATATASPTPAVSACPAGAPTKDMSKKPAVVLPAGSTPPADTTFTDVVVGKGKEARSGSHVAVKYVGVLFDTCQEFDSSWKTSPSQTLPFTIGSGVIPGFSKGTTGMRVGGRRQVIIPAKDGYGDNPVGAIPAGATLIFVIDLVSVS
jgi:FKBP-type peptidyl-prolyl cis-trans isomerase